MTTEAVAATIQSSIDSRGLPWPIRVAPGHGAFVTLSIGIRTPAGVESGESVSMPVPRDMVLLDGLSAAINKISHKANLATHMGLTVF